MFNIIQGYLWLKHYVINKLSYILIIFLELLLNNYLLDYFISYIKLFKVFFLIKLQKLYNSFYLLFITISSSIINWNCYLSQYIRLITFSKLCILLLYIASNKLKGFEINSLLLIILNFLLLYLALNKLS